MQGKYSRLFEGQLWSHLVQMAANAFSRCDMCSSVGWWLCWEPTAETQSREGGKYEWCKMFNQLQSSCASLK